MLAHPSRASRAVALAALLPLVACRGESRRAEASEASEALFASLDTVASPAAPGSAEPNLAVSSDGRMYLSWLEPAATGGHALRMAALEGGRWSPARTVASGTRFFVNWADFPSLVALPGGRLAAHWLERNGEVKHAYDVRIAQSADGGATWSAPVTPHRDRTASEHGFVSLWAAGDSVVALWLDGRKYVKIPVEERAPAKETMLVSAAISRDGVVGAERRVDERTCDCCQTAMAMTSEGPVVVYRDRSQDEIRDIYLARQVKGVWLTPAPVHRDGWRVDYCPVNGPAVDARGRRVAVAWYAAPDSQPRVQLAFSTDAGARFGPPVRIDAGNPAGRVDVVLRDDGSALVSWIERLAGERAEVRVREVGADGRAGAWQTVTASSAARASGFPRMASAGGAIYLAWTEPGTPSRVRVARAVARARGGR